MTYTPGPGDLLPAFAGHPHDPRMLDDDDDDSTAEAFAEIREWLAIAEIAYSKGDLRKLRQALEEAQATLEEGLA
jgi:hypothetical protein